MERSLLDKFIKKYNLNGNIESVRWSVDGGEKTLKVSAKSEDQNTVVYVTMEGFDAIDEEVDFGVYETKKLRQLLNVFDTEFSVAVNKKDDEVRSLDFSDANVEVRFVASSVSVVSTAPQPKGTPEFQVEILVDENFTEKFNRAKSALPGADTFTLMNNKSGDLQLILGYSNNNTDRITMSVTTAEGKGTLKSPLHFQSNILKEILSANEDCDHAVLKVSERGLANVSFVTDKYKSSYFMVAIPDVD